MPKDAKYLTLGDFNKALPEDTAKLYKVVNIGKRTQLVVVYPKYGTVNFKTLHVKRAEQLVRQGFPYLEEIKPSKPSDK